MLITKAMAQCHQHQQNNSQSDKISTLQTSNAVLMSKMYCVIDTLCSKKSMP